MPTTPNPTGGYFVIVPKSRVRELDMTVDEALKYIISMGVVVPRRPRPPLVGIRCVRQSSSPPSARARPARTPRPHAKLIGQAAWRRCAKSHRTIGLPAPNALIDILATSAIRRTP